MTDEVQKKAEEKAEADAKYVEEGPEREAMSIDLIRLNLVLDIATKTAPTAFPGLGDIHAAAVRELAAINAVLGAAWAKRVAEEKVKAAEEKAKEEAEAAEKAKAAADAAAVQPEPEQLRRA